MPVIVVIAKVFVQVQYQLQLGVSKPSTIPKSVNGLRTFSFNLFFHSFIYLLKLAQQEFILKYLINKELSLCPTLEKIWSSGLSYFLFVLSPYIINKGWIDVYTNVPVYFDKELISPKKNEK